jgi:hypothetical protein
MCSIAGLPLFPPQPVHSGHLTAPFPILTDLPVPVPRVCGPVSPQAVSIYYSIMAADGKMRGFTEFLEGEPLHSFYTKLHVASLQPGWLRPLTSALLRALGQVRALAPPTPLEFGMNVRLATSHHPLFTPPSSSLIIPLAKTSSTSSLNLLSLSTPINHTPHPLCSEASVGHQLCGRWQVHVRAVDRRHPHAAVER